MEIEREIEIKIERDVLTWIVFSLPPSPFLFPLPSPLHEKKTTTTKMNKKHLLTHQPSL